MADTLKRANKPASENGPAMRSDPHAGDPLSLMQGLATLLKDGLRTARFGGARLFHDLERGMQQAALPESLPPELQSGIKSIGGVVNRTAGKISQMERSAVALLLPERRAHVAFGTMNLRNILLDDTPPLPGRSDAFTRIIRGWVEQYLQGEGIRLYLVNEAALQACKGQFAARCADPEAGPWMAELAAILMAEAPVHGVLADADKTLPEALAADANGLIFMTLGVALTVAQSGRGAALPDDECLALAKDIVAAEWPRLDAARARRNDLAAAFDDLLHFV